MYIQLDFYFINRENQETLEIWRRLLESSYNFQKYNESKTQQFSSDNRPTKLNLRFKK